VSSEEELREEGVCVDVVTVTVTEGDDVGGRVMVEEVVMVVAEVVSLVTMTEVVESPSLLSLLVGASVPEPVAESVGLLEPESPVLRATV